MKHLVLTLFTVICFFLFSIPVKGQFYISGQEPASVRWNQINTDNFQIIFPEGFEKEGQKVTSFLESIYKSLSFSLDHDPKKVSVILHNQSVIANGMVTYAPFRKELFSIAPQDVYPQDWLEQLALHEFRHVVQLDKLNQGITRLLYFIFGEQAIGAVLGAYIHPWFFEGDAVLAETVNSASGRGRLPVFEMPLKSQVIDKGIYSYEKAVHGSFRDFVPDYYTTGYFLVVSGREKYGMGLWKDAINYPARKPYLITPFSKAIKKHTGKSKWGFYRHTLEELYSAWIWQDLGRLIENYSSVNNSHKRTFTSYRFPVYLNDSIIIAEKSGLSHFPHYVALYPDGTEEEVFVPGFSSTVRLSAKSGKIIWSEFTFDKRWGNRVWSDIICYDIEKKERKQLTKKQYLHAPDLSVDGKRIVAVETLPDNTYYIVILDEEGKEVTRYNPPGGNLPLTPSWSADGTKIVFMLLGPEGKSIEVLDLISGTIESVLAPGFDDISLPAMYNNSIYFHGTWSGTDNIYVLNTEDKKVEQITYSRYGARDVSISYDGLQILFADYTSDGFNVVKKGLNEVIRTPLDSIENHSLRLHEKVVPQEKINLTDSIDDPQNYEIKRYSKLKNLINIHSWGPISYDFSSDRVHAGVSILSQNLLSTTTLNTGYRYNLEEQGGGFYGNFSFMGWYPVLNASVSRFNRFSVTPENEEELHWIENSAGGSVVLPLNLTRGKYRQGVSASVSGNMVLTEWISDIPEDINGNRFFNTGYNISWYRYHRMALRDLRPEWGQSIRLNFRHSPLGVGNYRPVFSLNSQFFLPGLFRHHSFRMSGVYQYSGQGSVAFQSVVPFPRGYIRRFEGGFVGLYADYLFPLFYPDFQIGPLLYIKRFSLGFFTDFAQGSGSEGGVYRSFGTEVYSDFHFLNFVLPLNLGVRFSYMPVTEDKRFEIIYNLTY